MRLSQVMFQLTAFSTTVFVITVLAMVAMLLGDPQAPVNVWFNQHAGTVMTVEVIAIALFGLLAMATDRNETLREKHAGPGGTIASKGHDGPTE